MITKSNLGLFLLNLEKRSELYSIMNECESKYLDYSSENKQKITFEKMPISPIFKVEKIAPVFADYTDCFNPIYALENEEIGSMIQLLCKGSDGRELLDSNICCYSFVPLNRIDKSDKVAFSLPIDIDITNFFKPLYIDEKNEKALKHIEYNNIFQLLNKKFSNFDYKNIDDDYKMPYIYAFSIVNKNNEGINQRFQEIVKNILH